jgi:hypothetical protein
VEFFSADPVQLTIDHRNAALAALNQSADALLLAPADIVAVQLR